MVAPRLEITLTNTSSGRVLTYGLDITPGQRLSDIAEETAGEFLHLITGSSWVDFSIVEVIISGRYYTFDQGSHACSWGGKHTQGGFVDGVKLCAEYLDNYALWWAEESEKREAQK